jgi:hypothetical protein
MDASNESPSMNAAIQTLRQSGVVPGIAGRLSDSAADTVKAVVEAVLREVPAFTASGNPDVLPELEAHCREHASSIKDILAGRPANDLMFVRDHARRRAEQKFPLDAVLASFRCLHAILAVWIRDAALQSADESAQVRRVVAAASEFALEYSNAIGSLLTSEYVAATRVLAEAEGDRRTELLRLLLSGYDESDHRAAQLLKRAGYLAQRQSFCVAVARSIDPREMENAARAERMADSVTLAIRDLPIRTLVCVRDNLVTIIMSGTRRQSGWTAPQSLLADRVYPQLRTIGPAALIGISADAPSTSHIPNALSEAKLALDFASVADRVMPYARIPFRNMLIRIAAEKMHSALPQWVDGFLEADKKSRGSLTATLRAYAEADMNVLKTAKNLSIHPNTIYARMQRINDITKLNPLTYNALTELLLATDCAALDP